MLFLIKKFFGFLRSIQSNLDSLMNYIEFAINNTSYSKIPRVIGRILIRNEGRLVIGDNVRFNSSQISNYVGLYKPCTIGIEKGGEVIIGNNAGFSGVSIYCQKYIKIGNYVNCGGNVALWDSDFHPLEYEARRIHDVTKIKTSPVIIEDDVFIGANSIILKGVRIGKRSIIGAGSVVTGNIPEGEIWAGNPAKFLKKI